MLFGGCDLAGLSLAHWSGEISHRLKLHVAVLNCHSSFCFNSTASPPDVQNGTVEPQQREAACLFRAALVRSKKKATVRSRTTGYQYSRHSSFIPWLTLK